MSRLALGSVLRSARSGGYAVPACNVFDAVGMDAVLAAGERLSSPVIVQISTRTLRAWGPRRIRQLFVGLVSQRHVSALLHLDHCADPDLVTACMEEGWDSALFDASSMDFETAVRLTRDLVVRGAERGFDIEGEIDRIGSVHEVGPPQVRVAVDRSVTFVGQTGVTCFSPAAGTLHGLSEAPVVLDLDGLAALSENVGLPLVLHGGSGLDAPTLKKAVTCGIAKVNVSSMVKSAFRGALSPGPSSAAVEPIDLLQNFSARTEAVVAGFVEALGSRGRSCDVH
ncbi:class II fructose-bisphosphate aldolase [Streptomyces sp. MUM 203J]|uniref:class II fructose-bisphosphate aldolase n=1 Tax=Streptomyces sp. MUM 203J TaxID=2791990 RepID=UPI001F0473C0|nr:class II fructose-bisphosphate aldolase [Streptomyces sp. MUM 203J]MCH0538722.1 class II fructose-bisphosphate aldolase [Streptomyces sp. MUM 203J]